MNIFITAFQKILILFVLLIAADAFPQYKAIDDKVATYPKSFSEPQQLAARINADFPKEKDRARAIFTWIGKNIRYDMVEFFSSTGIAYSYSSPEDKIAKEKQFRTTLAAKTIRSGKAICEGYSTLFTSLCALSGLEAVIIPGTSRNHHSQIGQLPNASDHAWNAVKIDGRWELIDLSWAAGTVNNKKFEPRFNDVYFCTNPEKFALNHFPDDRKWLLTEKSPKEFADQPFFYADYLKSDYSFNIEKGFVRFQNNNPLIINIGNLSSTDRVYYITSTDNVLDRLQVNADNSISIYPSQKMSGYLTIFINEKPIVSYKIVRG